MKEILLNSFDTCAITHHAPGLWRHPQDRSHEFAQLDYWMDYARTLERGLFDGLFLADAIGYPDSYGGNADATLRHAALMPKADPSVLISGMASVTKHLGFGVTFNVFDEMPYAFARKISTLDHLTRGRIGWNVVTGYSDSAARGRGSDRLLPHDERYDVADEYMDVVYRLWETSWEKDALRFDRAAGVYADPARIHCIRHQGKYFRMEGIHMTHPSPQRTPLLYQAGTSGRGIEFAAKHAECVFISGPTRQSVAGMVKKLRSAMTTQGRRPEDIKIFVLLTVIAGETEAQAEEKHREYSKYVDREGALVLMSHWVGVDLSGLSMDEPIKYIKSNAVQSVLERFTVSSPDRVWTVGDVADFLGRDGGRPTVIGSPQTVASELEKWVDETDIDGFNLTWPVRPTSIEDFVELVVPELQTRKRYKTAYRPGTLREKLFGAGPLTGAGHPTYALRTQS
ncbi:MAG TPA: LLM class flavin-dependent oxidoreductase [Bradyrhizobium sp.]|nr:LLM class flavin-dependent oxidoreductase [Bradyrhizobium sp.]